MIPSDQVARLRNALPFWLSLTAIPVALLGAWKGGWLLLLLPFYTWVVFSILDAITGLNLQNPDPDTPEKDLFWYRLITLIWLPVQFVLVYGMIWWATHTGHLGWGEKIVLFYGIGTLTGGVGIVYSHELMHQKNRAERWLGDLLLGMVLYGHFRSEHLLVHHRHVGTPRDTVTARYNEGFLRFFPRVLWQSPVSAWRAEKALAARAGRPMWQRANPFWRYWLLQAGYLGLAWLIGGFQGLGLFVLQAFVAIWYLELTNYVEHYGLTRRHLGDGRYERVMPHHSWNAAHRATNWLLINLQRHSDHHTHPDRRFALLQNYPAHEAPQLPFGYPVMTALAMVPPLWRRRMNPRVRRWRAMYYPEITDWEPYKKGTTPMSRD